MNYLSDMSGARKSITAIPVLPWMPSLTSCAFLLPLVLLYWQVGGRSALLSDPNTGVHVRTGEWILVHHAVPRQDVFSFSIQGQAWCDWEWLSDVLYGLLHRSNGLAAIVAASMAVLCLMSVVTYRTARFHARPAIAFAVTCLVMLTTTIHWLARPHLFSWLFLSVFCWVVESSRVTGRRSCLIVLPLLMALWANIHPGFVAGLVLLAVWSVAAIVNWGATGLQRTAAHPGTVQEWGRWVGFAGLACLGATLANPYGVELHRHVLWYLFSPSSVTAHVTEWLSPDFHNPRLYWFELLLPFCAAAGLRSGLQRNLAWRVLSLGGIHLALTAVRNVPICAILCAAPVASLIEEVVARYRLGIPPEGAALQMFSPLASGGVYLGVASLLILGGCCSTSLKLAPQSSVPAGLVERLPPGRLFTTDSWADYLIYVNPAQQVFFDGRNDVYGPTFVEEYLTVIEAKPGWRDALMKYRITVVLVPTKSAIGAALASSLEWRLSYADTVIAVFKRSEM
jgi:hypothetical protein